MKPSSCSSLCKNARDDQQLARKSGDQTRAVVGVGAVTLLGFLTGKGARSKGSGRMSRLIGLTTGLLPLIKLVIQSSARKP